MGSLLILYITGSIINVLILLLFRSDFTYNPYQKKLFACVCTTASVLSFLYWVLIVIVLIIECVKYYKEKKDDKRRRKN